MGALEHDLSCAGMCKSSHLYSFSQVSEGPPPRNCSVAAEDLVDKISTRAMVWGWLLGGLLLMCALFSCLVWLWKDETYDISLLSDQK
eukprot:CAMPEP_0202972094 /NCGR_PEP_ID=MMETSP1396-20130829/33330_1 /ASSEMBLY_ACC=CAM_ASM_000872 /TAXON_ID= /ORGANISM="Pseudokeronopsis sp., Strain Brazil" /LENGTH=87 /DNA_ID=CAMNT_0049702131 /DNA_START=643 /DNA_END=903 /DNA_ORIENTATION=-